MNRMELVEKIAEKNAISKAEANRILGTVIDEVMAAVKGGESLTLVGFGTFKLQDRPARTGRNPQTGAAIEIAACAAITIPAAKVPKFVPSSAFKAAVNTCCKKGCKK